MEHTAGRETFKVAPLREILCPADYHCTGVTVRAYQCLSPTEEKLSTEDSGNKAERVDES
jgi:hypothetical protein